MVRQHKGLFLLALALGFIGGFALMTLRGAAELPEAAPALASR